MRRKCFMILAFMAAFACVKLEGNDNGNNGGNGGGDEPPNSSSPAVSYPFSTEKEKMASAIPAIWPIDRRGLRGNIGAFGERNHPTPGRVLRHTGIDLGGRVGAPVYATGDGVVIVDRTNRGTGYGTQVLVDHGFGYRTRYAHLDESLVDEGQRVRRGEQIATLGNTGRSTVPHLHYEVIYRGVHVNPVNYFRREMSDEEFRRIIESAAATTFEPAGEEN